MPTVADFNEKFPSLSLIIKAFISLCVAIGTLIGAFAGYLLMTNQELVVKGSCIPKSEIIYGKILRREAVNEIGHLIEIGEKIASNESETNVWLLQVLVFIHAIDLEQEFTWQTEPLQGQKMSAVEADIRWALLQNEPIGIKAQKILGVLKGLRAALQARI